MGKIGLRSEKLSGLKVGVYGIDSIILIWVLWTCMKQVSTFSLIEVGGELYLG